MEIKGNINAGYGNGLGTSNKSSILGGSGNTISNGVISSVIGGGTYNLVQNNLSVIVGGYSNSTVYAYGFVGGGYKNRSLKTHAVVVGGNSNDSATPYSFIGGGFSNAIGGYGYKSFLGGGNNNTINNTYHGAIVGGSNNIIDTPTPFSSGGWINFIGSGYYNLISGTSVTNNFIGSGGFNKILKGSYYYGPWYSAIVGGYGNSIGPNTALCKFTFIGGGYKNTVKSSYSVIGGGRYNSVEFSKSGVFAGYNNTITNNNPANIASYSVIGGGYNNKIRSQAATDSHNFIGGGSGNTLDFNIASSIGGGKGNKIELNRYSGVLGGISNEISDDVTYAFKPTPPLKVGGVIGDGNSFIVGGKSNGVFCNDNSVELSQPSTYSFIGGGFDNVIFSGSVSSVIGGGFKHRLVDSKTSGIFAGGKNRINKGNYSAIVGGYGNSVGDGTGTPRYSFIGGGYNNSVINDSDYSFIGGGYNNTINNSDHASILGGQNNTITHNNSHILGSNITSVSANTTHVEKLNIGTLNGTTPITLLALDTNGMIVNGNPLNLDPTFTGNTSGDCITDLYVTNIYGCSPLHIEPSGLNDVYMVENGGNVGVGTTTPTAKLHTRGADTSSVTLGLRIQNSNPTDLVRVANNGDVSINTTNTTLPYTLGMRSTRTTGIAFSLQNNDGTRTFIFGNQINSTDTSTVINNGLNVLNLNGSTRIGIGSNAATSINALMSSRENIYGTGEPILFYWDDTQNFIRIDSTKGLTRGRPYIQMQGGVGDTGTTSGNFLINTVGNSYLCNRAQGGNSNLSIGTTTATSKLHVEGFDTSSANSALNITNSATTSLLFVRNDGNIGIGTTSPSSTLDLIGSLQYTDGNQASGYVLTSDASGNATWQAPSSGSTFTGNTSGDCITDLWVSNIHSCSPLYINPNDEGNVYFGSTSAVTVDLTNDKLGVGTSSPQDRLHVTTNSSGAGSIYGLRLDTTVGFGSGQVNFLQIYNSGNAVKLLDIIGHNTGGYPILRLYDTSSIERWHIHSNSVDGGYLNGNFVIGPGSSAGSLSRALTINTNANNSNGLSVTNAAGTDIMRFFSNTSGHGSLQVKDSSGTITSNILGSGNSYFNGGNVGIGLTSPTAKLHTRGADILDTSFSFKADNSSGTPIISATNEGRVNIGVDSGIGADLSVVQRAGTSNWIFAVYSRGFTKAPISVFDNGAGGEFRVNGGTGLVYDLYNNVASLGQATNPNYKFIIKSSSAGQIITGFASSSGPGSIEVSTDISNNPQITMVNAAAGLQMWLRSNGDSYVQRQTGNFGVGLPVPTSKLHVKGFDASSSNSALNITNSGDTSLLFVRNDGNVGINTTTPSEKLDVVGNVNINGQIYVDIPTTLTPTGTTQTINWNDGNYQIIDLDSATGNVTLTFSNAKAGAVYSLQVIQGSVTRSLVYPATMKWEGGTPLVPTSGNDAIDLITMVYNGTNFLASYGSAYS